MTKNINIGIIGIGKISEIYFNVINELNNINIVAIMDIKKKNIKNVTYYNNLNDFLNDNRFNTIFILTPTRTHYDIAKKCLLKNKNILVEKPITLNYTKLDELIYLAKKRKLFIYSGLHAMFGYEVLFFKNFLKNNTKVKINKFICEFYDLYINNKKYSNNIDSLVGSWIDSGINDISILSNFINLNSIKIKKYFFKFHNKINISSNIELKYKNYSSYIKTDWTKNQNLKITTFFTNKDKIILNHSNQEVFINNKKIYENNRNRLFFYYKQMLIVFLNHYKNNKSNIEDILDIYKIYFNIIKKI